MRNILEKIKISNGHLNSKFRNSICSVRMNKLCSRFFVFKYYFMLFRFLREKVHLWILSDYKVKTDYIFWHSYSVSFLSWKVLIPTQELHTSMCSLQTDFHIKFPHHHWFTFLGSEWSKLRQPWKEFYQNKLCQYCKQSLNIFVFSAVEN